MPNKLKTVLKRLDKLPASQTDIIYQFKAYKEDDDCSERNVVNLLVVLELFSRELDGKSPCEATREDILAFLDPRKKSREEDPDEKWKTTWNYYRNHIATFFRWYTNKDKNIDPDDWEMPEFIRTIKPKKTKRLSPYGPNDVWLEEEIICVLKYCTTLRDKLAITLMWDMAGRNHEIVKLKIKHILFKEKYAIISIPWNSKTGERTNPAILSFPYLRDYINNHPRAYDSESFLLLSETTENPIIPDTLYNIMTRLRQRIVRLLKENSIEDEDLDTIKRMLNKPWNPYLVGRHSSITEKTDILLDHQLTSFAGWTVNTKRRATYSHRSGKQTRTPLLEHHGIEQKEDKKPSRKECTNCNYINVVEASICKQCNFVLNYSGMEQYEEKDQVISKLEQEKIHLEQKHQEQEKQQQMQFNEKMDEILNRLVESEQKSKENESKMLDHEKKMYEFMQQLPKVR